MALFCVVMDVTDWRFGQWGLIKERTLNRAFVVFELGTGKWYDVNDLELHEWSDTPERIIDRYFVT